MDALYILHFKYLAVEVYGFIWNSTVCYLRFLWTLNPPPFWSPPPLPWCKRKPRRVGTHGSLSFPACFPQKAAKGWMPAAEKESYLLSAVDRGEQNLPRWKQHLGKGKPSRSLLAFWRKEGMTGQWYVSGASPKLIAGHLPPTPSPPSQSAIIGEGSLFHGQRLLGSLIQLQQGVEAHWLFQNASSHWKFSSLCNEHPLMCTLD